MSIRFTDVRPTFIGSSAYVCPNECLVSLRESLHKARKGAYLYLGGSIASGGEVPLTVILPTVDRLKMVDHNYGSLFWACTKILLIKHRTNEQIRQLLAPVPNPNTTAYDAYDRLCEDFAKFMRDVHAENPLKDKHKLTDLDGPSVGKGVGSMYQTLKSNWFTLTQYWHHEILDTHLDAARDRLDNIEVIHGDIRDMGEGLDVLYISNALGHGPHDSRLASTHGNYSSGSELLRQQIPSLMSVNGLVLVAGSELDPVLPNTVRAASSGMTKCKLAHNSWGYLVDRKQPTATLQATSDRLKIIDKHSDLKRKGLYGTTRINVVKWPVGGLVVKRHIALKSERMRREHV